MKLRMILFFPSFSDHLFEGTRTLREGNQIVKIEEQEFLFSFLNKKFHFNGFLLLN